MGRIEKTVFISYRRTNGIWARAVYQDLTAHGYDAFFDYQSIDSGDFSQIILENIKGRAHFLVLLAPSALERCDDPEDWLRREIETAIEYKRNIIPLILEGFDFGNPEAQKALTGKLALLKNYNGLKIYSEYFDEGMARLRYRYLNIALEAVLHPVSPGVQQATKNQQEEASKAEPVKQKELNAFEWFEKGYRAIDPDEKIRFYSEFIRLEPSDATAYSNRGNARREIGDLDGAISDFDEAIRIRPDYAHAYSSRGNARKDKGNLGEAMIDYYLALRFEPNDGSSRSSLTYVLRKLGRYPEADEQEKLARPLIEKENEYNQACFESICGNKEEALKLLQIAIKKRPSRKQLACQDSDFENLHDDPRFKALVSE